jgi:urease accessory protein
MPKTLLTVVIWLLASPALAHHPLGGLPMQTLSDGLLSGIGHPVLGFDHLFFVILVGIAAVFTRCRFAAPAAYIAAMLTGCLITSLWVEIPASEFLVALSLLVLGSALLSGRDMGLPATLMIFAGFGLFHGAAFGAVLSNQEAGFGIQVLTGYLLGLGVTQYLLSLAAGWFCNEVWKVRRPAAIQPRLAGAVVTGAGLLLILEMIEAPLVRALAG